MSETRNYGRRSRYDSKSNGQHRRNVKSNSPPRYRSGNRDSRDYKSSSGSSRCIGVFGMSPNTTEDTLFKLFSRYGQIELIKMVNFTHTYVSRGFCFIYFHKLDDARAAKENSSGLQVDGRYIRVDFANTRRPFTPTPGFYRGRPSRLPRERERDRDRERYRDHDRDRFRDRSRRSPHNSVSPRRYRGSTQRTNSTRKRC